MRGRTGSDGGGPRLHCSDLSGGYGNVGTVTSRVALPLGALARPSILLADRSLSFYRMTPFEVATGLVLGRARLPVVAARRGTPADAVSALEAALVPALQRAPCLVSFSGGLDSSLVLILAANLARRLGLMDPVPVTLRFGDEPETNEAEWQELVIRHVRLTDWERLDVRAELDMIGPIAQEVLRRHGVIWHPLAFKSVPLFRMAQGGTVLTGEGGDEVLGRQRITAVRNLLVRRHLPRQVALREAARACAPRPLQYRLTEKLVAEMTWLRPAVRAELIPRLADQRRLPFHWHRSMMRRAATRGTALSLRNRALLASEQGCEEMHPLLDPAFLAALAPVCGRWGYGTRNALLRVLFPDVLPAALLERKTKTSFNAPAFSQHTREFAADWDGKGVDGDLVDPHELRRLWTEHWVDGRTGALLQQAWLATARQP